MIKTIIVAEPAVHSFLSDKYPDWDTQVPVPGIDAFWSGMSEGGPLDNESQVIIFSDQYYDTSNHTDDLEMAVATVAPHGAVMIISYSPEYTDVIKSRIESIAHANGIEPAKVYFISRDYPIEDIDAALEDYAKSHQDRDTVSSNVVNTHERIEEEPKTSNRNGMVIASTSSKGGSGKSTTSIMLAAALRKSSMLSVEKGIAARPLDICLVDIDIRDGQIGYLLGQMDPTSLNIRVAPSWDQETIRSNLIYHERLGINALLAPKRPRTSEDLPPDFYRHVIGELKKMFDIVILDTSVNYLDPLLEEVCYPMSDAILFVTDLGISSVFGMLRWLHETTTPVSQGGSGIDRSKVGVVVNKAMASVHMHKNKVKAASMGVPILVAVPHRAQEFMEAANTNRFDILLEDPEMGEVFYTLARKTLNGAYPLSPLAQQPSPVPRRR